MSREVWVDALQRRVWLRAGFAMGLSFKADWEFVERSEEREEVVFDEGWKWALQEPGRTSVDGVLEIRGAWWATSVRVATCQPLHYSFRQMPVIDGVRVQPGDRILVKNQPLVSGNGLFQLREDYFFFRIKGYRWAEDMRGGAMVRVEEGEQNAEKNYLNIRHRYYKGLSEFRFEEMVEVSK